MLEEGIRKKIYIYIYVVENKIKRMMVNPAVRIWEPTL